MGTNNGIKKEDIELGLNGNVLVIKGKAAALHSNLKLAHSERFYGNFQKQIKLPDTISARELSAKFWKGILFVSYRRHSENEKDIPIK
ncbi:Hsp20/alpha crystallin family protein [Bacillota bacterium Lsc_1132]